MSEKCFQNFQFFLFQTPQKSGFAICGKFTKSGQMYVPCMYRPIVTANHEAPSSSVKRSEILENT